MTNFDEFWRAYPGKKVAKPKCKEKYDKLSDEDHKEVMLGIQAQLRYRVEAKRSGNPVFEGWCNSQTFINQQRWYDEIGSHSELKEKAPSKICIVDGCREPVHAPKDAKQYCCHHYCYDESGRLRSNLGLVKEMRAYYKEHKEIHNLRGEAAIKFIKWAIKGIGK